MNSANVSTQPSTAAGSGREFRRWISLGVAAILGALIIGQGNAARAADRISVILDQAKVLQLPTGTATIIVGNPLVADVTMINRNTQLILTGKSFGETNMIALDAKGNSVGESQIVVKGAKTGLIVQRGMVRETWSCEPRCQPTVTLGDDTKYAQGAISAATTRAGAVAAAAK